MNLSISTLGCPNWSFETIVKNFKEIGITGIEVRGIEGVMEIDKISIFANENFNETINTLKENGLKIVGLGTSVNFHDNTTYDKYIKEGMDSIDVCAKMNIPYIRVFGNNIPDIEKKDEVIAQVIKGMKVLCQYGAKNNVGVNLEIHGDFNTIETLEPIVSQLKDVKGFGILWDVQHSDKIYGDDYISFYNVIKPFIKHVHIKDHFRNKGDFKLCVTGDGNIPIKKIIKTLENDGYNGYFSLEWEKAWHPELEEPETVFGKYAKYMNS